MQNVKFTELAQFQPKQIEAWHTLRDSEVTYLLYGGAMHGGKSYFLRWAALGLGLLYGAQLAKAGVSIGLFSEDYPTLKDRQISKISQEFPAWIGELKATQNEGLCFFIKPEYGGARILLRNLDDPSKYMSTEFAAIFVEELTKNTLDTFTSLRTRLRFPGIDKVKFCGATNPGGIGHVWCKKYWITQNSGDKEQSLFRYVPATLDDNKFTTQSYRDKIDALPERLKRAYKNGDWDAFEGQFFSSFDPKQVIAPLWIPPDWQLVGSMDPGWSSPLSFGLTARDFDGVEYRVGTYYQSARDPQTHAEAVRDFIKGNIYTSGRMPGTIVSGHDAWARKELHTSRASDKTMADAFDVAGVYLERAVTDRHNGWGSLKMAMPDNYKIFRGCGNEVLIDQLTQTLGDELDVEDIQGRGNDPQVEDHALDEARYGHMAIYKPGQKKTSKTLDEVLIEEMMDAKENKSKGWLPGMG